MDVLPVRRLTCPKCGGQFDYEFVPSASFTAIRLGNSRYTRCPLCRKFATFRMTGPGTNPSKETAASSDPPPKEGEDVRRPS
jgi:hypothetical protein